MIKKFILGLGIMIVALLLLVSLSIRLVDTMVNHFFNQVIQLEAYKHREPLRRIQLALEILSRKNISDVKFRGEIATIASIISAYGNKKEQEIYGMDTPDNKN